MTQWNDKEISWFINNYPTLGKNACMSALNKTEGQVRSKAYRLGLKQDKSSDFFKEWQSKAARGKLGKKRPEHSKLMKKYYEQGVISLIDTTTHNLSGHELYSTWKGMHYRCYSEQSKSYKNYGGRGIKVCEEWHDLNNFIEWGETNRRPTKKHTLDRIDNDGDYTPENCRWATPKQQARNTRANKLNDTIVKDIKRLYKKHNNQREVARVLGISYKLVYLVVNNKTWED